MVWIWVASTGSHRPTQAQDVKVADVRLRLSERPYRGIAARFASGRDFRLRCDIWTVSSLRTFKRRAGVPLLVHLNQGTGRNSG